MVKIKSAKLYNGKVQIDFYPNSHRYKKHGERNWLISVTTATGMLDKSRVLINWAVGLAKTFMYDQLDTLAKTDSKELIESLIDKACLQHQEKKTKAATSGTAVHEWAEAYINGEDPALPKDKKVLNGVMAFMKWVKDSKIKFSACEKLVYSKKHDYVGLMDAVGKIKGKNYVIDFKTSKYIYNEHRYQTSAYLMADEEESGVKYDGIYLVKFDKETGEFEPHLFDSREDIDKDFEAFMGLLAVKKREKELTKW
jgi:CRISPR/Cas system-associated exonuclease Cas4 (RecB family)